MDRIQGSLVRLIYPGAVKVFWTPSSLILSSSRPFKMGWETPSRNPKLEIVRHQIRQRSPLQDPDPKTYCSGSWISFFLGSVAPAMGFPTTAMELPRDVLIILSLVLWTFFSVPQIRRTPWTSCLQQPSHSSSVSRPSDTMSVYMPLIKGSSRSSSLSSCAHSVPHPVYHEGTKEIYLDHSLGGKGNVDAGHFDLLATSGDAFSRRQRILSSGNLLLRHHLLQAIFEIRRVFDLEQDKLLILLQQPGPVCPISNDPRMKDPRSGGRTKYPPAYRTCPCRWPF